MTSEPFEISVSDLEIGKYEFSAVMTDNKGKTYNSAKKNFEVKAPQAPYMGIPSALPGTVEMENYDEGGEGMSFSDSDSKNEGKSYRSDGVDIEEFKTGEYAIGWTKAGEWTEYTLEVKYDDEYTWTAYAASGSDGSSFKLYIDDKAISQAVSVKNSGDWKTFREYEGKTGEIEKGKHILKVAIEADFVNIDRIEFKAVNDHPTGVENIILQEAEQEYNIYTMQGIYMKTIKVTENAITDKLKDLKFNTGAYIAKRREGGKSFIVIVD